MCVFFSSSSNSIKLNKNRSVKMFILLKHILSANSDIRLTLTSMLKMCLEFSSDSDVVFLMWCYMSIFEFKFMMLSDILQYFLMMMLKFFMTFCRVDLSMSQSDRKNNDFWMLELCVICIAFSAFSELIRHEYSVIIYQIRSEMKSAVLMRKLLIWR